MGTGSSAFTRREFCEILQEWGDVLAQQDWFEYVVQDQMEGRRTMNDDELRELERSVERLEIQVDALVVRMQQGADLAE
jgi:hypothetical protein